MTISTVLWRRLDAPGHDACRLAQTAGGWRLEGAAVFRHEGEAACLTYRVVCDGDWFAQEGEVQGWVGALPLDFRIRRGAEGVWTLNSRIMPALHGCIDLDLGFTPATNVFQLQRVALQVGQAAAVPVAWLDVPAGTLDVLHQHYERRAADIYWYEAPRFGYGALLTVNAAGFVVKYPDLWEAEF
ncbi:MAG: putative glycolipid-binding domain-containing protein [Thermodesulfobacteriota bacterium]